MKWSTTVALAVAPLGTIAASNRQRSAYPVSPNPRAEAASSLEDRSVAIVNGMSGHSLNQGLQNGVVIIWVNPGNGAKTTTINQQVTVTKTVTAGPGEATTIPVAGGGMTTISEGQTATVPVAGAGATHTVKVGGPAGLVFVPDQLNVPVDDNVVFEFLAQNHTVTQSPFDTPCKAMEGGMDSGFMANPNNTASPPPKFAMRVATDKPIWFYCKQKGHCGKGMVFSINPTANKTQAMFQSMAIAQNGTGEATPITGGTGQPGAAPPPPPPPAENSEAPKEGSTSTSLETPTPGGAEPPQESGAREPPGGPANAEQPGTTPLPLPGGEGSTGATPGQGTVGADGSCTCVVACNAGGFPAAGQGNGAFGGFAGALPTTMSALR